MRGRADHSRPRLGAAVATILVTVTAFFVALTVVFFAIMWGATDIRSGGILFAIFGPLVLTTAALALVVAQKMKARLLTGRPPGARALHSLRNFIGSSRR